MPESIEWRRRPPRRRRFLLILALIAIFVFGSRTAVSYYVDALWFGSLGYGDVFRKTLSLRWAVFAAFFATTFFILYGWFLALRRAYQPDLLSGGIIFIGRQPLKLPVERILRLIVLVVSLIIATATGAGMMAEWPTFALYWYAPRTTGGVVDPIFGKPLHFYLFTLPAWQFITGWLLTLGVIACVIAVFFILITGSTHVFTGRRSSSIPLPWRGFSIAFALLLLILAMRVYIGRFEALFDGHTIFGGVTYTEREAKAVSKLSHPHICTLHDIGHQEGMDFLVMELLEGETLEQRLIKGPLPPEQTLRFAGQIADALAKAHKMGITHRDLKPSNVMLTKTGAKLMDFGLAKETGPAPLAAALTEMTADQAKLTVEGTIIGTFQYMAPEQLEGKEADARTDIFALGEVIYEMATGKPAFSGKGRASLIAAILTAEPQPISQLQPLTPHALERVVKKCLAKGPDERWQSASDLASELKWIAVSGSQTGFAVGALAQRQACDPCQQTTCSSSCVASVRGGAASWVRARQIPPAMHFNSPVPFAANDLALSPDGRVLALVAYSDQSNKYVIWTHEVGSRAQAAVPGTEGASHPFWSPDGRSIGFFANGN